MGPHDKALELPPPLNNAWACMAIMPWTEHSKSVRDIYLKMKMDYMFLAFLYVPRFTLVNLYAGT